MSYGRQWFIHCIYTVRSKENARRGIGKRSIQDHVMHTSQTFIPTNSDTEIGRNGRGTNMNHIVLDYTGKRRSRDSDIKTDHHLYPMSSTDSTTPYVVLGIVASILIVAMTIMWLSKRKATSSPTSYAPTIVSSSTGQTRIISQRRYCISDDHTEV